jgi:urea transport system ATP-binding protein
MLTVRNLEFSYGAVRTLRDLSLTAPAGRITAIMGRNGVGKTTLMRNIMGQLQPAGGEVRLGDRDLSRASANVRARSGIALVPQGRQIFPKLTVEENLRVGLQARADGRRTIPDDVYELFPVLRSFLRRRGGDLSGGQQQQLAIARALVGDPKVLLLDEPTEGIQPNVIQQIGQVLRRLVAERNMIVLLVEQYLDFVKEFAAYFYIMNRGQIVADGQTNQLEARLVNEHLGV